MLAHKLLAKEDVLENELRARIMEHLLQKPGSYLGKIGRELDVPTSTLKYHLNILKSFDLVTTVKKGRCRHYFPKKKRFTDLEKRMYAAIEHDPTRRIVEIIYRNPGISQGGLVRETGLSQSTVAWHMAKLEDMNLIRSHRNDVKEYYLRGDFETVLVELEQEHGAPTREREGEGTPAGAQAARQAPSAQAGAAPTFAPPTSRGSDGPMPASLSTSVPPERRGAAPVAEDDEEARATQAEPTSPTY